MLMKFLYLQPFDSSKKFITFIISKDLLSNILMSNLRDNCVHITLLIYHKTLMKLKS